MAWTDDWVGKRYAEGGRGPQAYDCLGLFLALQHVRCGLVLPDPACTLRSALRDRVVEAQRADWRPVDGPREGDALMFRVGRYELHVGFCLDARMMIHIERDGPGSVVQSFLHQPWRQRLTGVFRYHA